jgi:hypothetical protein
MRSHWCSGNLQTWRWPKIVIGPDDCWSRDDWAGLGTVLWFEILGCNPLQTRGLTSGKKADPIECQMVPSDALDSDLSDRQPSPSLITRS